MGLSGIGWVFMGFNALMTGTKWDDMGCTI